MERHCWYQRACVSESVSALACGTANRRSRWRCYVSMVTTTSCQIKNKATRNRHALISYRNREREQGFKVVQFFCSQHRGGKKERKERKKKETGRESEINCGHAERVWAKDKEKVWRSGMEQGREMKERRGEWMGAWSLLLQSEKGGKKEKSCLRNSIQPFLRSRGNLLGNPSLGTAVGEENRRNDVRGSFYPYHTHTKYYLLPAEFVPVFWHC